MHTSTLLLRRMRRLRALRWLTLAAAGVLVSSLLVANASTAKAAVDPGWGSWRLVPGNGATYDAPGATDSLGSISVYLAVRGTDNRIYLNTWGLQVGWNGWGEVPGNGHTLAGPTGNSYGPSLFVRGTDSGVYANRFNGSTWSGWGELPGKIRTPSAPASPRESNEVFVRGTDNRIYGNRSGSWVEVPGNGRTLSAPAAVVSGDVLFLFVRGTDNRIYLNRRTGSTWTGWGEVPGGKLTYDAVGTVVDPYGGVSLFARGTDNHIYKNYDNRGASTWSGWTEVGGNGLTVSAPAATIAIFGVGPNTSYKIFLFVRGTDNRIYYNVH